MSVIDYQEHISRALDYIEENLPQELDNALLARIAGYSEYHFLRIFKDTVKLTPADYIKKRRLTEIVRCMADGKRPVSDIAFAYGFNSKENFSRAFKAEHGILPTEFKAAGNSLRLYERVRFHLPPFQLDAVLEHRSPFCLVAYPSDESYPPRFWNKYNAKNWSQRLSGGAVVEDIGACIWNPRENRLDYYIGIRKQDARGDLSGTVSLTIAGGLYAVFVTPPSTNFDFVNTIHKTWDYIEKIWLPENGFERTGGFEFESYIEQSRKFSEKIYIPIQRKEETT